MPENRIRQFDAAMNVPPAGDASRSLGPMPGPFPFAIISTGSLYQAAAEQAVRDHELNKLFNPEFYGEADEAADDSADWPSA